VPGYHIRKETKDEYLADLKSREPEEIVAIVTRFIEFDGDWPYESEERRQQWMKRAAEDHKSARERESC